MIYECILLTGYLVKAMKERFFLFNYVPKSMKLRQWYLQCLWIDILKALLRKDQVHKMMIFIRILCCLIWKHILYDSFFKDICLRILIIKYLVKICNILYKLNLTNIFSYIVILQQHRNMNIYWNVCLIEKRYHSHHKFHADFQFCNFKFHFVRIYAN